MDATTVLTRASETAGTFILAAGAAMLTVALIVSSHEGRAQAGPAPTVTVTPAPRPVTVAPSPSPSPSPSPTSATLVVDRRILAAVRTPRPDTPGAAGSGRMGAEQTPPGTASPPHCTGRILALQVRVAALPDCITLGGSR